MRLPLVAAIAVCAACPMAVAQYESSSRSIVGIGYAIVKPSGSQLRGIKSTWTGPTIDINFLYDDLDRPRGIITIGLFGEKTGEFASDTKAGFMPVKLSYIKHYGKSARGGWYVGGGVDAYFANYKAYEYDPFIRDYAVIDQSGVLLGVNLLAGIEFGGAWYGEMRYDVVKSLTLSNATSVNFGGLSFVVGSRLAF